MQSLARPAGDAVAPKDKRSASTNFRVTTLAESLRYFSGFAVGETAAILSEAKVECGGGSFPRC
jgi:hypothetical protein